MDATIIIAIVPVVLLVAYIVWLVRAKITEGREIDLREPITGVVICLVAVLIIGSMTASTVTYSYSEDTNTLYINQNLIDSNQPFDSYGDEVKSVVIGNNCKLLEPGTLDSLTNLEYISIGKNVEVRNGAFSGTFLDPAGSAITVSGGMEFLGKGDGTLYYADPSLYTVSGTAITGLASGASPTYMAIPSQTGSGKITSIANSAFRGNTSATTLFTNPSVDVGNSVWRESNLQYAKLENVSYGGDIFRSCASLTEVDFFEGITELPNSVFAQCTSLDIEIPATITKIGSSAFNSAAMTSIVLPEATEIGSSAFYNCTNVTELSIPKAVTIGAGAFTNCRMTEVYLPGSIQTIEENAFRLCRSVTSVTFGAGFSASIASSTPDWVFYASDGTTVLDKTVTSNFAGKSFQGTVSALIEVAPGQLSLTPQQIQQVQLHTQELQQQDLDVQPMPFQPTVQTQDQEPAAA